MSTSSAAEGGHARLEAFAALTACSHPDATDQGILLGSLDEVGRAHITGWACNAAPLDAPARFSPVRLRILANGVTAGEVLADRYRPDLEQAGIGCGRHGFEWEMPGGFSPMTEQVIQVQRATDGRDLANSPRTLAPLPAAPLAPAGPPGRGRVDLVTRERVVGWAQDDASPEDRVALQILDNGVLAARVLANRYRPDLAGAAIGSGRHGFEFAFPGGLAPLIRHIVTIKRERDGTDLPGSPVAIEAASGFDAAMQHAVANAVAALVDDGEPERVLSFMMSQANHLLQKHADSEGRRAERQVRQQWRRRPGKAEAPFPKRALVLDERIPAARRDAGSNAILSHMHALQRLGYAVTFVAAGEMTAAADALAQSGITCGHAPFYTSVEDVLRRQTGCFDVIYLHRAEIAARYANLARTYAPHARILYSVADLHHIRLERQAAIEGGEALVAAARRMALVESINAWSADAVITHSAEEARALRRIVPKADIHRVPWDVTPRPVVAAFEDRSGVAFIGGYAHTPNIDAARFLAEIIMPLVWQTHPTITCTLAGSDMPAAVRRLARPGLIAAGYIPDLGTGLFAHTRLTVAPLRYGAGVKGKVLESLAAGLPCVMSPVAAEGIALTPVLEGLVGADAAAMAALICHLHDSKPANAAASASGLDMIRHEHNPGVITAALAQAIAGRARPQMKAAPPRLAEVMQLT